MQANSVEKLSCPKHITDNNFSQVSYMINIKFLGILSRLCSFTLLNDNLFNKLFVSEPEMFLLKKSYSVLIISQRICICNKRSTVKPVLNGHPWGMAN